ncbi:hypothetical protein BLA29_004973 [Euroglyphus maynei]|uniref:Uncharacterized protein n=1 Tax=Euroglyphus maynei TaxID=6958 RepID=A0A1Y3B2X9_EURMA|nr:hypothetical protein BLA29_004973 [Euroglyphus maynei]
MKFLVYSLVLAFSAYLVFGFEVESERNGVVDALLKNAETLKKYVDNDLHKYLNNTEDFQELMHLERDMVRVEFMSDILSNLSSTENMTEHHLHLMHQRMEQFPMKFE